MHSEFFSFKISREFVVLLIFIVITFFFVVYETKEMGVGQLQLEAIELEKKIKSLQAENERLMLEIEDLKTDVGVIRLAREKLRLVFPGEIVIKALSSEEVQIQKLRNMLAKNKKIEIKPVKKEVITLNQSQNQDYLIDSDSKDEFSLDDIKPDDIEIDIEE